MATWEESLGLPRFLSPCGDVIPKERRLLSNFQFYPFPLASLFVAKDLFHVWQEGTRSRHKAHVRESR